MRFPNALLEVRPNIGRVSRLGPGIFQNVERFRSERIPWQHPQCPPNPYQALLESHRRPACQRKRAKTACERVDKAPYAPGLPLQDLTNIVGLAFAHD